MELVIASGSYAEITPSGSGIRIIGTAAGSPFQRNQKCGSGRVESYRSCARYITVTGWELPESKPFLADINDLIDETVKRLDDANSPDIGARTKDECRDHVDDHPRWWPPELLDLIKTRIRLALVQKNSSAPSHGQRDCGRTVSEIEAQMRSNPRGVAQKYLNPSDRLRAQIEKCFTRADARSVPSDAELHDGWRDKLLRKKGEVIQNHFNLLLALRNEPEWQEVVRLR